MPVSLNPIVQNFLDKAQQDRPNPLRSINRTQLPLGSRLPKEGSGVQVNPTLKVLYGQNQPSGGGGGGLGSQLGFDRGGATTAPRGAIQEYAQRLLQQRGWGDQWGALDQLVTHESGWRPTADNPTSTAYGLFQFLDSTRRNYGLDLNASWQQQVDAGLRYIQDRYGSPAAAWAFWQRNHWY